MPAIQFRGDTGTGKTIQGATAPGPVVIVDCDTQFFIYLNNPRMPWLSKIAICEKDIPEFGLKAGQPAVTTTSDPEKISDGLERLFACSEVKSISIDPATHPWRACIAGYQLRKYGPDPEKYPEKMPFNVWGTIKRPYKRMLSLIPRYQDKLFLLIARNTMDIEGDGKDSKPSEKTKAALEQAQTGYETPYHFLCLKRGPNYVVACEKEKGGIYKIGQEWINPMSRDILQPVIEQWKQLTPPAANDEEEVAKRLASSRLFESPGVGRRRELAAAVTGWLAAFDGPALAAARAVWNELLPEEKEALKVAKTAAKL